MVHNAPGNCGRVVGGERTWRLVRTKETAGFFAAGERDAIAPSYRRDANDPTRRAAREKRGSSRGQAPPFQGRAIAYGSLLGGGNTRAACSTSPRVRGEVAQVALPGTPEAKAHQSRSQ